MLIICLVALVSMHRETIIMQGGTVIFQGSGVINGLYAWLFVIMHGGTLFFRRSSVVNSGFYAYQSRRHVLR
jgi:hypothetical protein